MSGPRFSSGSFAHNRWAVGPATSPNVSAERDTRLSAKRTAKFKRDRIKKGLRQALMRQNPFCTDCGILLQMIDNQGQNYACVIGVENPVLCCPSCANDHGRPQPAVAVAVDEAFGKGVLP